MATKQFVGLSFSFCVSEVLEKRIKPEQIAFILAGFDLDGDWGGVVPPHYYNIYWRKFTKEEVDAVVSQLTIRSHRGGHNVSNGIWWPLDRWSDLVPDDHTKRLRTEELADYLASGSTPCKESKLSNKVIDTLASQFMAAESNEQKQAILVDLGMMPVNHAMFGVALGKLNDPASLAWHYASVSFEDWE